MLGLLLSVRRTLASSVGLSSGDAALDRIIEASPSLHTLKKRCAYLVAFLEFVVAKAKGVSFQKPVLNASYLDKAFVNIVKYVQFQRFGAAIKLLSKVTWIRPLLILLSMLNFSGLGPLLNY